MIASATFNTTTGMSSFFNPVLTGVFILCVKREGLCFRLVTGTPGSMECKYVAGFILFQLGVTFTVGEKIWVLYEN